MPFPAFGTRRLVIASLALSLAPVAVAQQASPPQEPLPRLQGSPHEHDGNGSLWTRPHLTGDWGGLRPWLREHGVTLDVFSTSDASRVVAGGVERGFAVRTLVDATATIASEPLLGYGGGTCFLDVQSQGGDDGSRDTGDLQRYSDIDHDHDFVEVAMLWYEHAFADDTLFVRLGKDDVNTSFQALTAVDPLLHASFGHSPNLLAMPTYPDTAFGAQVFWRPAGFWAGLGIYDGALQSGVRTGEHGVGTLFGAPADLYGIGEVGCAWTGERAGRVGVGAWHLTGALPRFDGATEHGTTGCYALGEQVVRAGRDEDGAGEVAVFAMYGFADADVSDFDHCLGAGVAWTGPWSQRPRDVVGLGLARGRFSRAAGSTFVGRAETAIEISYGLQVTPWCTLKPVLTWIDDPGGLAGVDDALVLTLRTALTF